MKKLSFLFLVFGLQYVSAQQIPTGTFKELTQFISENGQKLPQAYVQTLPGQIHQQILESERKFKSATEGKCVGVENIQFLDTLTNSQDNAILDFEAGFVRMDVARCFRNVKPQILIDLFSQAEFRKKAFTTITDVNIQKDYTCEMTSAPFIGKSSYCYTLVNEDKGNYVTSTSMNYWNSTDLKNFPATVYFKEIYMTSRQVGNDSVLHIITYVRGPKFSDFEKIFGKTFIANMQSNVFNVLEKELKK